jgi:hypothetical protein
MKDLAQLFWQLLNVGFLDESIGRVRVEYDDDRVNIRAATFDGARRRRIKLKRDRVRNVYYYDVGSDSVRKDKFDSHGRLEHCDQRRAEDRVGAQVKRKGDEWRVRDGEDRDDALYFNQYEALSTLTVVVGPPLGSHDDTTSLLSQFARDLAQLEPKLVKRERRVDFWYDSELTSITVVVDQRKRETFTVDEM